MKNAVFIFILPFFSILHAQSDPLPSDVSSFVEKRDGCDHFRGEDPYDEERKKFLEKNIIELCVGTDKALANLKIKYQKNESIIGILSEYESSVEINKNL